MNSGGYLLVVDFGWFCLSVFSFFLLRTHMNVTIYKNNSNKNKEDIFIKHSLTHK